MVQYVEMKQEKPETNLPQTAPSKVVLKNISWFQRQKGRPPLNASLQILIDMHGRKN